MKPNFFSIARMREKFRSFNESRNQKKLLKKFGPSSRAFIRGGLANRINLMRQGVHGTGPQANQYRAALLELEKSLRETQKLPSEGLVNGKFVAEALFRALTSEEEFLESKGALTDEQLFTLAQIRTEKAKVKQLIS